jgi:hypothetical protein
MIKIFSRFFHNTIFDSSNAVLGMAFTPPPPLEKVIAFCTAKTKFVLHANKTKTKLAESRLKTSKVVKKGGKKSSSFGGLPQHLK